MKNSIEETAALTEGRTENNAGSGVRIGDKYEICGRLGHGGGGQVYRVYDRKLDRFWAAKKVRKGRPGMEERALGKVKCGAFPRIVDVVEKEDCHFLIMDWIDGESLQKKLERTGPFSAEEAVRTGIMLCDAIASLHEMQPPLLYLDCKPSNIIMDKDGKLWLVDFGSVVETAETDAEPIAASPGFAAPEQMKRHKADRRVDVRTDVFGLGRTLYALLTARNLAKPPFAACGLSDCRPDIPRRLMDIVEKCMEENPERRYQTIRAAGEALREFEETEKRKCISVKSLFPLITWLLLGVAIQRGRVFYKMVSEPDFDRVSALYTLFTLILPAAAASLWQRFAAEKAYWKKARYEPLQSVLRTEKKPDRWLILLLLTVSLMFTAPGQILAREDSGLPEKLPVILRDCKMRKLLVKDGAVLTSGQKLYLELNPEMFEKGKELEIRMTATDTESTAAYEYVLRYCPVEEEQTAGHK